jgi:hypothetical protein
VASRGLELQRRIYRAMLALHPRRFRREYGAQMLQLFTDQLRHSASPPRVWMSAFNDLALSVSSERLEESMRSNFIIALGGATLATVGSVGVVTGRGGDGLGALAASIGLIVVAVVGTAVMLRRAANQPSALAMGGGGMVSRSVVGLLKWAAVPVAGLGLVFAFFGVAWGSAVHSGVAVGLLAFSGLIWKGFGGGH